MALTYTTASGAISTGATLVTLSAFTNPASTFGQQTLLRVDNELMKVTDASLAPTLQVVRGWAGTTAINHTTLAPVTYGLTSDFPTPAAGYPLAFEVTPNVAYYSLAITATGATGSTAAPVAVPWPAFIDCTASGASGAGINLPYPYPGASYTIKNSMTGALKIYSVGATMNGTTGTTAVTLTATGNLQINAYSTTAGAWLVQGNT